MDFLSILFVRLLLPVVGFSSNLLLLGYLGVDRFAALATLLQGSLLATVLLKFGTDDAMLYGRSKTLAVSRRLQPEFLLGIFGLMLLFMFSLVVTSGGSFLTNGLQVLILGFLNAQLSIAVMRLQVQGHVWFGNVVQSLAAPLAVVIGASFLPTWWPALVKGGDSIMFFYSIGIGFAFWLILLSLLLQLPANGRNNMFALSQDASSFAGTPSITPTLWLLQIIDVLLLSGDIILLGLFNKLEGLEYYIAAGRLAVASTFVLHASEQYFATIQRSGRQFHVPYWLPGGMLAIIPFYVLVLSILGIQPNVQYDRDTLVILMTVAAVQSLFLRSKVHWAGQVGVAALHTRVLIILLLVAATISGLCWLGLELEMTAAMRAACFGTLALLTRWALYRGMEAAGAGTRRYQ